MATNQLAEAERRLTDAMLTVARRFPDPRWQARWWAEHSRFDPYALLLELRQRLLESRRDR